MDNPTLKIEDLMEQVLQRKHDALEAFYNELLGSTFFILERAQRNPLSDQPKYPSDFFGALAVKDKDRAIVPVFTRPELIADWAGTALDHKQITAQALFNLIPDDWWACLNPGTEVEKDFSPWEVAQLRHGASGIREILEEFAASDEGVDFNIEPLQNDKYPALFQALEEFGRSTPSCSAIYGAREFSVDTEGAQTSRILLGLEHSVSDTRAASALRDELRSVAGRALIGDEFVRIVTHGPSSSDPVFSALRLNPCVYMKSANAGLWARIWHFLRTR